MMHYLAYDVGGSSIKYAVIDETSKFLEKGQVATPATIEGFYTALQQIKDQYAASYDFRGVGFSLPGAVDNKTGIIGGASAIDYIHNFNIKYEIQHRLALPIAMENDANCAALGEVWQGAAKGCQDVLFFVCGSGVGGAVVKDGHIHHGPHLHGGEFGYMMASDSGYQILSEAASTVAMAERIAAAKGLAPDAIDGKKAFALAADGDKDAQASIEKMYNALARAIYNVQYAYDPERIVLGGAISSRPEFAKEIQAHIDNILAQVKIAKVRPEVVSCQFGNDANLLGAVKNFLQQS
jgi:glucokinase